MSDIWFPTIAPETRKPVGKMEPYKAPESVKPVETPKFVIASENKGPAVATTTTIVTTPAPPTVVVDLRTGKEKTHRVDPQADSVTKEADLEEQGFIEKVEEVHSII